MGPFSMPSNLNSTLIDTHTHLDMFSDPPAIIASAHNSGVSRIITIGTNLPTSKQALQIAQNHSHVFTAIAIYPGEIQAELKNHSWQDLETQLHTLTKSPKVVAIGETGLDYSPKQFANFKPHQITQTKSLQKRLFKLHLNLAAAHHLPVIIHNRDAHQHILQPIKQINHQLQVINHKPLTGVFHCFSGNEDFLKKVLDLGFYISFAGNLTYPNAASLQHLAIQVPDDRLLLETDAPFLPPQPHRGSQNQPAYVKITAEFAGQLRHQTLAQISQITTQNARRLFHL